MSTFEEEWAENKDIVTGYAIKSLPLGMTYSEGENTALMMFYRAWKRRERIKVKLSTYACRSVHNTFFNYRRDKDLRKNINIELEALEGVYEGVINETAMDILSGEQLQQAIIAAVEAMPEKLRETYLLRDMEYTYIAATLHIPIGTVRSRLSRARGYMAEALEL